MHSNRKPKVWKQQKANGPAVDPPPDLAKDTAKIVVYARVKLWA